MKKEIKEFKGEYFFLSNFYECEIICNDFPIPLLFHSSEALFQALKCPARANEFTKLNPNQSKRFGRKVCLRSDWEDVKIDIMKYVVDLKFSQNKDLKEKLLLTDNAYLEEGNTWGDVYWGTVNNSGQNMLGKILMELREKYSKERNIMGIKENPIIFKN